MKKGIAILLITILVFDLVSCNSYKQLSTQEEFEIHQKNDHIQVFEIHSRQDSIIVFNEYFPGKLANNQVYGLPQIHFPFSMSDSIRFITPEKKTAYIQHNGIRYKIISQNESGFICVSPDTIRTSFSDITQMNVKKKDPLKSTLLIVGLSAAVTALAIYIVGSNFDFFIQEY